MKNKTVIDLVFDKFNTLSDADFKSWMLNNHDELKEMEREWIESSYFKGADDIKNNKYKGMIEYYNETFGGDK